MFVHNIYVCVFFTSKSRHREDNLSGIKTFKLIMKKKSAEPGI